MSQKKGSIKKMFTSKQFTYGSITFVMTAAVIGILLILNIIVSSFNWKIDLTPDKMYSISEETVTYLKSVDKDVKLIVFYDSEDVPNMLKLTFEEYERHGMELDYVDPNKDPGIASKYVKDGEGINNGTIVVESGDKFRKLEMTDLFDYDYTTGELKASNVEQKLAGAISYVTSDKEYALYELAGHNEMPFSELTTIHGAIESLNFQLKQLNLFSVKEVPEDANVLAIVSPQRDISTEEKVKLESYLEKGGRVMIFLQPHTDLPNLSEIMKKYNMAVENDIVVETDSDKVVYNYPLYLKPELQNSGLTSNIVNKNLNIIFPGARSLSIIKIEKLGLTVESLAKTTNQSWGETNFEEENPQMDAKDLVGPLDLALSAEKDPSEVGLPKSRLVVFGNASFLTEEAFQSFGAVGNYDLFTNTLNWLGEAEDSVMIPSKALVSDVLNVTTSTQVVLILIIVLLIPIAVIIGGVVTWARRRHL